MLCQWWSECWVLRLVTEGMTVCMAIMYSSKWGCVKDLTHSFFSSQICNVGVVFHRKLESDLLWNLSVDWLIQSLACWRGSWLRSVIACSRYVCIIFSSALVRKTRTYRPSFIGEITMPKMSVFWCFKKYVILICCFTNDLFMFLIITKEIMTIGSFFCGIMS